MTYFAYLLYALERVEGIEPSSSAWKADIMAFILHPQEPHRAGAAHDPLDALALWVLERAMRIELTSQPWQGCVLTVIRCPHAPGLVI